MTTYSGPEDYLQRNPFGGVARVFDSIAERLRAGEDYAATLADYGLQEAPAAPVGDDALVNRLRERSIAAESHTAGMREDCRRAADRLEAQAARIAELERDNAKEQSLAVTWMNHSAMMRAERDEAMRQLAAAQVAIAQLLERVEDIGCVNCHRQHRTANPDGKPPCVACAEAIAAARRAFDEATK